MTDIWRPDGTLSHVGHPDWLSDSDLQKLMTTFEDAGFQIFAVGGCVRDTILRSTDVQDVDLSTDARPEQSIKIIESLDWKALPTGIEHGTITAVSPMGTFEITTFRKDVETDGRHADVAFSEAIEDDAKRRDFTINAFYADRFGNVKDIVGGSLDLRERRVRFIGDPMERIREDFLRILRFFRFTASIGKQSIGVDADGLAACAELADGLRGISRERVGAEMTRIVGDPDAPWIVGVMEQSGVLNRILPGASVLTLARLVDLEDQCPVEGRTLLCRDLTTRLASLGCEDIADRLRLPKVDARKIDLVLHEAGSITPPHELAYRHGYWTAFHCLHLRWASFLKPYDAAVVDDIELGASATFPIKAADLMPAYSGKALGDRLRDLEDTWIASRFTLTKPALLNLK